MIGPKTGSSSYLAYIVECAVTGREDTVFDHKGKQVRDQVYCDDVARLMTEFFQSPRCVEVYNLGGGRPSSASILETIGLLAEMGLTVRYKYDPANRVGGHICYIADLGKVHSHFPNWEIKHSLLQIISEIAEARSRLKTVGSESRTANKGQ